MSAPYNVIRASSIPGVVLDCVVNPQSANVGKTISGGTPTDNTALLNQVLAQAGASGSVKLILDGGTLCTGLIFPAGGHYEIEGIGWDSGIFMKAGSNSNAIYNNGNGTGFDKQTTPPARGGYVRLSNFCINGNRGNGTTGNSTTGDPRGIAASYWYMNVDLANLQGVRIEDMYVYDSPGYAIRVSNCGDIVVRNNYVVNPCTTFTHNQDCVHLSGPWDDAHIEGNTLANNFSDDAVALNAPEGYGGNAFRSVITGNTIGNCYNALRVYGGKYPAGATNWQVYTVVFSNNTGTTSHSAMILGGLNTESQDTSGQSITAANNTITVTGGPFIDLSSTSVGELVLSNCVLDAPQSANAFISCSTASNISNLVVGPGCGIYRNTTGNNTSTPLLSAAAALTISRMTIDTFQVVNEAGQSYSAVANLLAMTNVAITSLYLAGLDMTLVGALADSYTNIASISGPGLGSQTSIKTGTYTLLPTDGTVFADATTAAFSITLPAKQYAGHEIKVVKTDASANIVTLVGTISGAASPTLPTQYNKARFETNGTAWFNV